MLQQLSSIDWSELSHAYGPANEVPQLLSDLTSHDEPTRSRALGSLHTTIYHQGTVYQASAYAAPFFIELVQQEEVPRRDEILLLLAHLATGDAYHRQHMQFYDEERKQDPTFQQEMAAQMFWVEKTHEAVKDGIPIYVQLLKHQDVRIRMGASRVLGAFSREAAQLLPILFACLLHERDQRVLACLLYEVTALIARHAEAPTDGLYLDAWQLLTGALEEGETDLVCLAVAMALVWTRRPDVPVCALDLLLETLVHPEPLADIYEELPWAESR